MGLSSIFKGFFKITLGILGFLKDFWTILWDFHRFSEDSKWFWWILWDYRRFSTDFQRIFNDFSRLLWEFWVFNGFLEDSMLRNLEEFRKLTRIPLEILQVHGGIFFELFLECGLYWWLIRKKKVLIIEAMGTIGGGVSSSPSFRELPSTRSR